MKDKEADQMEPADPYETEGTEYEQLIGRVIRGYNCGVCTWRTVCIQCRKSAERVIDGTMNMRYLYKRLNRDQTNALSKILRRMAEKKRSKKGKEGDCGRPQSTAGAANKNSFSAGARNGAPCPMD